MKANRSLVKREKDNRRKIEAKLFAKRAYPPPQTAFIQEIVDRRERKKGVKKNNKYCPRGRTVEPGICQATTIPRTGRLPVNIFADYPREGR